MEPAREPPWAEHEKVYLLAEILKAHPVQSQVLFNLVRELQVQPKWKEMALPPGRSLNSCQRAYQDIAAVSSPMEYRHPMQFPQLHMPGSELSRKRPLPSDTHTLTGRLIQPRPPHSFPAEIMAGPTFAMSSVSEPAQRKKRGRPTKAEQQARAEQAAARGEVYPPPKPQRPARAPLLEPVERAASEPQLGSATPAPAAGPPPGAAAPAAITPTAASVDPPSETSSGKKRRGRPTRTEADVRKEEGAESVAAAESPSLPTTASPGAPPAPFSQPPRPVGGTVSVRQMPQGDVEMGGIEEAQQRAATKQSRSFKETVGM